MQLGKREAEEEGKMNGQGDKYTTKIPSNKAQRERDTKPGRIARVVSQEKTTTDGTRRGDHF